MQIATISSSQPILSGKIFHMLQKPVYSPPANDSIPDTFAGKL